MKKLILILVSVVLSASFLSAAVLNLDSVSSDIRFFNEHGYQIDANGLDKNYTAVTGYDNAIFTSEYGTLMLYEKSVITIGTENGKGYIYLIKGNAQFTNNTDSEILIKTPESKVTLSSQGTALINTDASDENILVFNGEAVKTDILSGKNTTIENEFVFEEKPVQEVTEEPEPIQPVSEEPVAEIPVQEPLKEEQIAETPELTQPPVAATETEESVAEELTTENPVSEQSAEEPETAQLPVEVPETEEPVSEQPVEEPETAQLPVEVPETEEPVSEQPAERVPTEIKETVTGEGFSFGFTAHADIRNLKLDSTDPECVRYLKEVLKDAYWYAGLYVGYNSFRLTLNANDFNTDPANYQLAEIPEDKLIPHFIKLGFSFINEIKYGSDGTLFSLRLDRNSDIKFKNTAFGQMDHDFSSRTPLAFSTAVKTDIIGGNIFINNLSLDDSDISAGLRLNSSLLKNKKLTLGLSAIALTDNMQDYVLLPGADIKFMFVSNSKTEFGILLSGIADIQSNFKKFNAGAGLSLSTGPLKIIAGGDLAYGAFLSRIVDYGNNAYEIATTSTIAANEFIVNAYTDLSVEFDRFYADLSLNIPLKFNTLSLCDAPVQDLSLKLGADLGKIKLFAAAKFDGLFYELAVPQTLSLEKVLERAEKLGAGAEFSLGSSVLSIEGNYQPLCKIPVSLSLGLTANIKAIAKK